MKYWVSFIFFLIVTSNTNTKAFSQDIESKKEKSSGIDLDIGFAPIAYKGDLQEHFSTWSGAFTVGVQTSRERTIKPHLQIGIGSISGQNLDYPIYKFENGSPNTSFYTTFFRANLDLKITVFRHKKIPLSTYIAPGIGLIRFVPHDDKYEKLEDNSFSRAEGETYNTNSLIIPTALGFNYSIKKAFSLQTEVSYWNPRTDYIDNISQFGEREKKDNIFSWRISLIVPIGGQNNKSNGKIECPTMN